MSQTLILALVGFALVVAFIQALFLHLAAKFFNVESTYGKALKVAFVLAIVNGGLSVFQGMSGMVPQEGMHPGLILAHSCGGILLNVALGTGTVAFFYAIPVGRAMRTYVTGCLGYAVGMVALVVVAIFGTAYFIGDEAMESWFQRAGEELNIPMNGGRDASSKAYDPLQDVEFTEFENAVDVKVSDARQYVGRKVRVVHGRRSESIGTLKEVRSDILIVSVKIEGGRVDLPIKRSKITTFQLVDG